MFQLKLLSSHCIQKYSVGGVIADWHSIVCKEWGLFYISQILILQGLFLENVFQSAIQPSKPFIGWAFTLKRCKNV